MRRTTLVALLIAAPLFALGSTPASAFGWCRGYGYGYGYGYAPYYAYRPYYRPRAYSYYYGPRWWGGRGYGYRSRWYGWGW